MRPIRFVAVSEDGQALILTDEVGRMLSLAIDENVVAAVQRERTGAQGQLAIDVEATLTPRDIQSRIRSGDTAEHVARLANVPMEKVLRFAGPVLQERAAMAELARRTRLKGADSGQTLADIADARLRSHGVNIETVAWDAYRRDDGGWRVTATWPSGKATAHAQWDLDRPRSTVMPVDDMAQFLSAERQQLLLAQEEAPETTSRAAWATRLAEDADPKEGPTVPPLSVLRKRARRDEPAREPADWSGDENDAEPTAPEQSRPAAGRTRRDDPWREEARRGAAAREETAHQVASRSRTADPRPEPRREENWRERLDPTGLGPVAAADGPGQPRARRAELPSWDDILFGSRHTPN